MSDQIELQQIIGQVAAAYFNNNHVTPSEISVVIGNIAASIAAVGGPDTTQAKPPAQEPEQPKLTPAQIRRSITQDKLISFEDGKSYSTLRRHLASKGMTPEDYRSKWGLPKDYPMASPAYSKARSNMAKARGFGNRAAAAPSTSAPSSAATLVAAAPAVAAPAPAAPAAPAKKATAGARKAPARGRTANAKTRKKAEPST